MKKYFLPVIFISALTSGICQSAFNFQDAVQSINESEYDIQWQQSVGAYQSPNREQNLRSTFNGNIISILPRVENKKDNWNLQYEFTGLFRGQLPIINVTAEYKNAEIQKNQITYTNDELTLEYINSKQGLRQNFILPKKISGTQELILKIKLTTNLTPVCTDGCVYFYNAWDLKHESAVLIYTDLNTWDANGRKLNSSIQLKSYNNQNFIELHVDDSEAVYPITVDPLTATPVWVLHGDLATGYAIRYTATGDFNGDGIKDLLTANPLYTNGQTNEGIVKLHFGLPDGTFDPVPAWSFESNITSLNMGDKLACAGDVNNDGFDDFLIGCNLYDNVQTNEGIVYMFLGSPSIPSATPNWAVESNSSSAEFGNSVAGAGDINNDGYDDVIIGAHKHTTSGRAFVYLGNATGLSTTGTMITGAGSGNEFGFFVTGNKDLNGDGFSDIVITGTNRYGTGEATSAGRIYVYNGSATGINTTASWYYTAKQSNAHLGQSAALADVNNDGQIDIITSAIDYDTIGTDYGLVYVFLRSVAGYPSIPSQLFLGTQTDEDLGTTISSLGDINNDGYNDIAVGSPYYDQASTSSGRTYVFKGSSTGLNLNPIFILSFDEAFAYCGRSVTPIGDSNGDGFDDFVVVNAVYDEPDIASALLYFGNNDLNAMIGLWNKKSTTATFGATLGHMDMNQDGLEDLMVGAPYFDGGSTDEGKLFVYWSDPDQVDIVADWTVESQQPLSLFGASFCGAGDVNGDGFVDIAVGATDFDVDDEDDGAVLIYFGNAEHKPNEWMRQVLSGGSEYANSYFGNIVLNGGDVNQDGFDDIIVNAPYYDGDGMNIGTVYVYGGSPDGIGSVPIWDSGVIGFINNSGLSVVCANFNGDGYNDLLISADDYDYLEGAEGRIDLFYGSPTGLPSVPSWTLIGSDYWRELGERMNGGGDVNGDGYDDFIVSETYYHYVSNDSTRFMLYYGSPTVPYYSGWHKDVKLYYGDGFGDGIFFNGDINGDGYDEIIFGDDDESNGQAEEGLLWIYNGGLYGPETDSIIFENNISLAHFGSALTIIPDMNNDGANEMWIGAPEQVTNYGQGVTYLFYGQPTTCPEAEIGFISSTETTASFSIGGAAEMNYLKWKSSSSTTWNLDSTNSAVYLLDGLSACENYQIKIQAGCDGSFSKWTDPVLFSTNCPPPCALPPTGLFADNITSSSAKLHWNADPDATKYKLSYKKTGAAAWTNVNATSNSKSISGLLPSTNYQYKVKSVCGALQSPFSPVSNFTTLPMRGSSDQVPVLSCYPNPVENILHISNNINADELVIYDGMGAIVLKLTTSQPNIIIETGLYASGIYLVTMKNSQLNDIATAFFTKM